MNILRSHSGDQIYAITSWKAPPVPGGVKITAPVRSRSVYNTCFGGKSVFQNYREKTPAPSRFREENSGYFASHSALLRHPHLLAGGRAHLVGRVLRTAWDLEMSLQDLPVSPRWTINSTTYETGKNWRFSHKRMGDYLTGYVLNPDFPVADAAASSAGFPGGIGPLKLKTNQWEWVNFVPGSQTETQPVQPLHRHYHLWDGGVYENLGSEALIKPGTGLRDDIDFYIASDAGRPMQHEFSRWAPTFPPYRPPLRLLDCAMDQIRAVRARSIHGFLRGTGRGKCVYLQIGLSQSAIFREAGSSRCDDTQDEGVAKFSARFPTTLRRLTAVEYETLFEHGYRVANATLAAWVPGEF